MDKYQIPDIVSKTGTIQIVFNLAYRRITSKHLALKYPLK